MNAQRRVSCIVASLMLISALVTTADAAVTDNWNVDGEHGELHVHGLLSEGACRLDMTSQFQDIPLGNISQTLLDKPGDEGLPVHFQLILRDCSRSGGGQTDRYTGTTTWDAIQPVVTLTFSGVTDSNMPTLLKTTGVTGLGLKLTDPLGRLVQPGERGKPMFITPGDNFLNYWVTPVRTPAALSTGEFNALARFEVSYD